MTHSVLIVDDDRTTRLILRITLEREGFAVTEAVDGPEALAQVQETRPDAVVLDAMMPDMDGPEVCRILRRQEATADLPIIMVSGWTGEGATAAALEAGATECLTKPVSREALLETMDKIVPRPNGNGR